MSNAINAYKWKTEDIYESNSAWEKDYELASKFESFEKFKGKLGEKSQFVSCMEQLQKVSRLLEKLSIYAYMKHDEDTRNSVYDALNSKVEMLAVKLSTQTAFITPELTALDQSVLQNYIQDKELSSYDYMLKCVLKQKAHVLSENEEKLLANASEALSGFKDIFKKIDNADLPLGEFEVKGKKYPLTHGLYSVYLQNPDVEVRKSAFKQYYQAYTSLINTIASTYIGNVKKDCFYAKARNYGSALEKALAGEDVVSEVYYNLLTSVNENLPLLHKYIFEKRKSLGIQEMHMYDVNMPAVEGADLKLEYDEAYNLVVEGLSVLGEEYKNLLLKAKNERWIDVYEQPGKRSGAYSIGVYDTHPYVLLNYQKTTHDVFTIAHEMGHSIHTYFSNKTQPYEKADYKIFVAEVASTVNEVLLIRYLLAKEQDVKIKKYLLSYLMEMIRTTLYRQTQFAEFEEFSHSTFEKGVPLTKDNLTEFYYSLNKKYYGEWIISDEEIGYEWSRIPHFYTAFYVYKYSTGIISALAIANRILTEGEPAIKDYFSFLSSGSKDNPVELLKIAGVDLTDKQTFNGAFKMFGDALEQFQALNK